MIRLCAVRQLNHMMSVVLIATLFFAASVCCAQDKVEEPQYVGHFDELSAGSLVELEPEKMDIQAHTTNYHFMVSHRSELSIVGPASPVRVLPAAHFVVRTSELGNIDPNTLISLKMFVVKKSQRTIPESAGHATILGSNNTAVDTPTVALTFKSYGQSSLEIVPVQPLEPGEYAFTATGVASVYCFGVDSK